MDTLVPDVIGYLLEFICPIIMSPMTNPNIYNISSIVLVNKPWYKSITILGDNYFRKYTQLYFLQIFPISNWYHEFNRMRNNIIIKQYSNVFLTRAELLIAQVTLPNNRQIFSVAPMLVSKLYKSKGIYYTHIDKPNKKVNLYCLNISDKSIPKIVEDQGSRMDSSVYLDSNTLLRYVKYHTGNGENLLTEDNYELVGSYPFYKNYHFIFQSKYDEDTDEINYIGCEDFPLYYEFHIYNKENNLPKIYKIDHNDFTWIPTGVASTDEGGFFTLNMFTNEIKQLDILDHLTTIDENGNEIYMNNNSNYTIMDIMEDHFMYDYQGQFVGDKRPLLPEEIIKINIDAELIREAQHIEIPVENTTQIISDQNTRDSIYIPDGRSYMELVNQCHDKYPSWKHIPTHNDHNTDNIHRWWEAFQARRRENMNSDNTFTIWRGLRRPQ